jgi:hypothetical protein
MRTPAPFLRPRIGETPAGISAGIALDEALAEGDVIRILRGV